MKIKIGTRKSRLALAQTALFELAVKTKFADIKTEIVTVSTLGDKVLDKPVDKIGGKGVFCGELEFALKSGVIDVAVHSAKDLPIRLADGLEISGVLPRGDCRDMLIARKGERFARGDKFTVGTGSPRRKTNLARLYPNAVFEDIRGNVDTRLKKLQNGGFDAVILCAAGLERLGIPLDDFNVRAFEYTEFLPSPCQAIIAAECASGSAAADIARAVSDKNTMTCFETEREIISLLGADCAAPTGAYSEIRGGKIYVMLSDKTGKTAEGSAVIDNAPRLVKELISKL